MMRLLLAVIADKLIISEKLKVITLKACLTAKHRIFSMSCFAKFEWPVSYYSS